MTEHKVVQKGVTGHRESKRYQNVSHGSVATRLRMTIIKIYRWDSRWKLVLQELSSCWDGRPFDHNRHGTKSGGPAVSLSVGELGPHLTQCRLGRGLPPYQVASWSIQPFGHNTPTLQTVRTERQDTQDVGSRSIAVRPKIVQHLARVQWHLFDSPWPMGRFLCATLQ